MVQRQRYRTNANSNRPALLRQLRAEIFKTKSQLYMRDEVAEIDFMLVELNRTPFISQPDTYRWYVDTLIEDLMLRMMPREESK